MGILKKFSIADWLKQVGGACRRFPVAVLLLVFLSAFLIIWNHGAEVSEKWWFFYVFYPATGSLLAVSLQLLTEDFKSRTVAAITQIVVHLLWLGVSFYLAQIERFSIPQLVAVNATVVTMALSMFLLCFYRKGDDVPFWNFAMRLFVAIVAGLVVGGILTLGIILFLQSLDWLFGLNVNDLFPDVPAVCMVLLAPMLAMSQIPEGEEKHDRQVLSFSGFIKGVAQYLFIPLLLLYMATLYVYTAKILFTWQLPVGWVCYLVTASMLGMLFLIFITYPLQYSEGDSIFKKLLRWLPLAMLPLLVLMSVAIGRRLSDYGITVSRLYVVVFNIWCYIVCIGLLLTRNKRLWWVVASFAVVLFLISVGPQSIANITLNGLKGEARTAFSAAGFTHLPLTPEQYEKWLKSVDSDKAYSIDDKLAYLKDLYGYHAMSDVISEDAHIGRYASEVRYATGADADLPVVQAIDYKSFMNTDLIEGMPVLRGYERMAWIDDPSCEYEEMDNQVVLNLRDKSSGKVYRVPVRYDELEALDDGSETKLPKNQFLSTDGNAVFVINEFHYAVSNDGETKEITLTYSGLLFMK